MAATQNASNQHSSGIQVIDTSAGATSGVTMTGSTNISVSNGSGISGNPTVSITGTIPVSNGGTGTATLATHAVVVGEGTSAVATIGPGTAGQTLVSGGAAADPSYVTPTAGTGLTVTANATTLQYALATPVAVSNGGTGAATLAAHTVVVGEGTSAVATIGPGTAGQTFVSGGAAADPSYVTPTAGTGLTVTTNATTMRYSLSTPVIVASGGTGVATLTAHALLVGEGTSAVATVGPSATAGQILQSGGATADPSFSTVTYPSTTTVSQLLYSSSANTVAGLATANSAALLTNSSGVPSWSTSMTNGQVIIGSTGATPTAAALTAGARISITNGAGSITIAATSGYSWTDVTGTSQTMAVGNGYIADNVALVTLTLPAAPTQFGVIQICGNGAGLWKVAQVANHTINFSGLSTTTGVTGSLAATDRYDCVEFICVSSSNPYNWTVMSSIGDITVT